MVNEVIMYQSMFLLGVIAFGVFAYSFNTYTDQAEQLTYESNIDLTNQKVGDLLLQIIGKGQEMELYSANFELSIYVYLDSSFANKAYYLQLSVDPSQQVLLESYTDNALVSSFNTGQFNGASLTFDTSQILVSSQPGQYIYYTFTGGTATVGFAASV